VLPFYSNDASESNIFTGLMNYMDDDLIIDENSTSCLLLSVADSNDEQAFEVYPNPANSEFVITYHNPNIESIEILSMSGSLVKRIHKSNSDEVHISVADWTKGIYLVKINAGDQTFFKKIVIQ
jgi:hypothetical protein